MGLTVGDVLGFPDPISYADTGDELHTYPDKTYVHEWEGNSFFSQMIDLWGEVKRCFECRGDERLLERQLGIVRDMCMIVYSEGEKAVSDGEKWEMKAAEWMLYDYLAGGNRLGQSERSAIGWWHSMSHGINYDLLC